MRNQNKISSLAGTFFTFGWREMLQVFKYAGMFLWWFFKMSWYVWLIFIILIIFRWWFERRIAKKKANEYNSTKGQIK